MSRRRNIRRSGGGGGGGAGGSGLSYQSILGANLLNLWHSQLGIALVGGAVDTWTDQVAGSVLQAPAAANRPAYAADGALFKNKPVVQCLQDPGSGPLWMQTAQIPGGFPLTGARPYLFCVVHWRDLTAGTHSVFSLADLADTSPVWFNGTNAQTSWRNPTAAVTANSGATPGTVLQYSFKGWCDGVNSTMKLNAASFTAATALALAADIVRVRIAGTGAGANSGSVSIALLGMCLVKPSTVQEAALDALIAADFG